jgi:hypothetical protein
MVLRSGDVDVSLVTACTMVNSDNPIARPARTERYLLRTPRMSLGADFRQPPHQRQVARYEGHELGGAVLAVRRCGGGVGLPEVYQGLWPLEGVYSRPGRPRRRPLPDEGCVRLLPLQRAWEPILLRQEYVDMSFPV